MTSRAIAIFLIVMADLSSSVAQPASPGVTAGGPELPGWATTRLEALRPEDPWAYFLLAEELSYEVPSTRGRDAARTLFVLAYHLDHALGPHVCLALADLSVNPEERQWLIAMAASMGAAAVDNRTEPGGTRWAHAAATDPHAEARWRLAEGLRAIRAEDGRPLREAASASSVTEYLAHLSEIDPALASALTEARNRALNLSGCARCRSQRVIAEGANKNNRSLCPRCGGNPGLALDDTSMLESLRTEAQLRGAEPTSWSGIIVLREDRPLRDIRPNDLARTYKVDPMATRWSAASGWRVPDSGSDEPAD